VNADSLSDGKDEHAAKQAPTDRECCMLQEELEVLVCHHFSMCRREMEFNRVKNITSGCIMLGRAELSSSHNDQKDPVTLMDQPDPQTDDAGE